jgi:hypothetical protein
MNCIEPYALRTFIAAIATHGYATAMRLGWLCQASEPSQDSQHSQEVPI